MAGGTVHPSTGMTPAGRGPPMAGQDLQIGRGAASGTHAVPTGMWLCPVANLK